MEFLESNEEARLMAEETIHKLKEVGEVLDPEGEQEQDDCDYEGVIEHPDYLQMFPDDMNKVENKKSEKTFRPIEVEDFVSLCEKTRELDIYQKRALHEGISYARNVVKARISKNKLPESRSIIIHGGAGCGKSKVINILKQ